MVFGLQINFLNESNQTFDLNNLSNQALARDKEGPHYGDDDKDSFWDHVWDNTFNRDWRAVVDSKTDINGKVIWEKITCENGDSDSCDESESYY